MLRSDLGVVLAGITARKLPREFVVVQPGDVLDHSERSGSIVEGVLAPFGGSGAMYFNDVLPTTRALVDRSCAESCELFGPINDPSGKP